MSGAAEFDHLVLILRDQLVALSPRFEAEGYCLTDVSVHNLGSINRLITLDNTYIELLGWPAGKPPARKEIAVSPLGLDALVFRTHNAQETWAQLKKAGFDVNPVTALERPIEIKGQTRLARFNTVRFAAQPIDGFRVYFCQHLTPEYVWADNVMHHSNGAKSIKNIIIKSSQPQAVAQILSALTDTPAAAAGPDSYELLLANTALTIQHDASCTRAKIETAILTHENGLISPFNTQIGARQVG